MAHYKNNNNKTSFIPTENKKKKKKFTKEQLIVFILMIFWTISSVLGIIAFTSNVVKAEEPLTVYAEEPDYNYSPPKYNDVNYNEFNPCRFPTMNLLGVQYMVNDSFTSSETTLGTMYTLTRTSDNYVSEWFYNPFTYLDGTYTACIRQFHYSSNAGTQISLQFQTSNNVNFYVRFKNNSASDYLDMTVNFTFDGINPSSIVRCRFVCSNSYPVGQSFTFYAPVLYRGDTNYPYSPYFGTYCDIASDYAYEKGWQDSDVAYDKGYEEGYLYGYSKGQQDFQNKYGSIFGGIFQDAKFRVWLATDVEGVAGWAQNPIPDLYFDYGLDFNRFLGAVFTNNETGETAEVTSIQIFIDFAQPFDYSSNPLYTYPYKDKSLIINNTIDNYGYFLNNIKEFETVTIHADQWNGFYSYSRLVTSSTETSFIYPQGVFNQIFIEFNDNESALIVNPKGVNNIAYDLGYEDGLKDAMSTDTYIQALQDAKDKGEAIGYNKGVEDANTYSFLGLMGAVVDAPLNAFIRMFDFDILGFNMKSLYLSLFTACLLIVIVKKVI